KSIYISEKTQKKEELAFDFHSIAIFLIFVFVNTFNLLALNSVYWFLLVNGYNRHLSSTRNCAAFCF
ncbi:hypothetical protein, partial [Amedibacillus hominis]